MDLNFPYIPDQQPLPGAYMDIAADNPAPQTQRTLMIGQCTTASPSDQPQLIGSVAKAVKLYGAGSMLASMVERYLAADPLAELWTLAFADAGGSVAATGQLDFTGSNPTEAGVISLWIAGRFIQVPVAKTDTATAIALNVKNAINAYVDANDFHLDRKNSRGFFRGVAMPVSAAINGGNDKRVDLTANNKGTLGNLIDIQANYFQAAGVENFPNGVALAITAMSGGTGDPDMSVVDARLGDTAYDFIVHPYCTTTSLNVFRDMMANDTGRWAWSRGVFGHCFTAMSTGSNGSSANTFALGRNDPHHTIVAFEQSAPATDYDVAAWFAGAYASASRADPARPVQTRVLPGMLPPLPGGAKRFTKATQTTLLNAGLALLSYDRDGTVRILRAVTTYKTDANGARDISYRDTETLYTLMAYVRRTRADLVAQFPRAKLASNGTNFGPGAQFVDGLPDQAIATPNSIRAALIASYQRRINEGLVQDKATFAKYLQVQIRSTDPSRVDALVTPILVGGLRVMATLVNFLLQSPAA